MTTSNGSLCIFDSAPEERLIDLNATPDSNSTNQFVTTKNRSLLLNGGGLISTELAGLREALSRNGQLTFGVKFKTNILNAGRPPRLVVALQSIDKTPSIIAQLIQNVPNATISFSF